MKRTIWLTLVVASLFLALAVLMVVAVPVSAQASTLIINEIIQNPSAVSDGNGEWLELYNAGAVPVDIDGCTIRDDGSDSHTINNGGPLIVGAASYVVLGNNSNMATNGGVTVTYAYTPSSFYLSNSDDEVILECGSVEIDRVEYDGGPSFPDPTGASMQLIDPALDNNVGAYWCDAENAWSGSAGDSGTPGAKNDCSVPNPVINEIIQNPSAVSDTDGEWFELYNPGTVPFDINGCTIKDAGTDSHTINNGLPLLIPASGFVVLGRNGDPLTNGGVNVAYTYTTFFLSNSDDEVILECDGSELDRVEYDGGSAFPDPTGASMQLIQPQLDNNVGANWCEAENAWPGGAGDYGTPGAANDCPIPDVVINEIIQNPSAVSDGDGEWFELYNADADPFDVNGCTIKDNDTDSHVIANGGPLTIAPLGYIVLGINGNPLTNGGVTVAYTYSTFFLANGDDEVILECDGIEIDRVEYDNGVTFPDPNGASMQLIDPTLDNNVGANWCEAANMWPGGSGDFGTPGDANDCPVYGGLLVEKVGPTKVDLGEAISYTLTITNDTGGPLTNLWVSDTLPLSVTYDSSSPMGAYDLASHTITWTHPSLSDGAAVSYTIYVTAPNAFATVINEDYVAWATEWTTPTTGVPVETKVASCNTIYDIQYTPDPGSGTYPSRCLGEVATIEGIVYAVFGGSYYIAEAAGPWHGIRVFSPSGPGVNVGDYVQLTGTVDEYYGRTDIPFPTSEVVVSSTNPLYGPDVVTAAQIPHGDPDTTEPYESVFVEVHDIMATSEANSNGEWTYTDASPGTGMVDGDTYHVNPTVGEKFALLRGPLVYDWDNYKIFARDANDVWTPGPTLAKEAASAVEPGQFLTYTLTVENKTGQTLTNLTITDAIPTDNTVFVYALDGGVELPGDIVSWTVPSLAHDTSVSVRFVVRARGAVGDEIWNDDYAAWATEWPTPTLGGPVATIIGDYLRIHHIQGDEHLSSLTGISVKDVPGIVTAKRSTGFWFQDPIGDGNDATSEGIWVYTGSGGFKPNVGDYVEVDGTVLEYYPGGSGSGSLSTTEIEVSWTDVISTGNPLPAVTVIGTGGRIAPDQVISSGPPGNVNNSGPLDPITDGIDFYESLEGMWVRVNDPIVVGGTNYGTISVVGDNGANAGDFTGSGGLIVQPGDFNPETVIIDDAIVSGEPTVDVGASFTDPISGVIDYTYGRFNLFNVASLPSTTGGVVSDTVAAAVPCELRVASFNVYNLDPGDSGARYAGLAGQIVNNLQAPDIIGLQEIQDNNGTTDDGTVAADQTYAKLIAAIQTAGGPIYDYRQIDPLDNQDGGAPGSNIRVAFLYRTDRGLTFVDRPGGTATNATMPVLGADGVELTYSPGRVEPNDIAWNDVPSNDAWNESRKALAGEFTYQTHQIIVVVNHLKSKGGDDSLFGTMQPPVEHTSDQRSAQGKVLNTFVDSILALDPAANVFVLGDLNDFQFSEPVSDSLAADVLTNLAYSLPHTERYSYIYQGNSQMLDHILVSDNLYDNHFVGYDAVHVNAEWGYRSTRPSDHDPVLASCILTTTPEIETLDLVQSTDASTWEPVSGTLTGGYTMTLCPTTDYHYLTVDDLTATVTLDDAYHPFYLVTGTVPAGYYDYWAARGVYSGTTETPWQPQMWQIISGQAPMFYLKVDSGGGEPYRLVDGLQRDLGQPGDPYLRVNGEYPPGDYTFTGVISSPCGVTNTLDVNMTFENKAPEIEALDLMQSVDASTWEPVSGTLSAGYVMTLCPTTDYHYLTVEDLTATVALDDAYHPFYLVTGTVPAGYYDYWAARGVYSGTTEVPWQPQMWQIISGQAPMFYLKVDSGGGEPYRLVDGLQHDLGQPGDPYLRVNGEYPPGDYTFTGVISSPCGITNTLDVDMTFANDELELEALDLMQSVDASAWEPVSGTLTGGYTMTLCPTTDYHYLTVEDLTATVSLDDAYHPFYLVTGTVPAGYYDYWAGRNVYSGTTGTWEPQMWQIISGQAPMFYLKVDSGGGEPYKLVDGLQHDLGQPGDPYLRVNGEYPPGDYTFTGVISSPCGMTNTLDVDMTFANDELELEALDLMQSVDASAWEPVSGTLTGGYTMTLCPTTDYHYLTVDDLTATVALDDAYHPFYLVTGTVPAGYYDYWAARGVYSGTTETPWQPQMWQIISGQAPMFYLKVDKGGGEPYKLVDGLQHDLGQPGDPYLRVNGEYPPGDYTFTGVISSECGITDTVDVDMTFTNDDLELEDLDLVQSLDQSFWEPVSGTLSAGYAMTLCPAVDYYYLTVEDLTATVSLHDGYHPFYLVTGTVPAGYYDYWADRGVYSGTTEVPWQPQMWQIISGQSPMFYLKVESGGGEPYMLVDGLQRDLGDPTDPYLRLNGEYPVGDYAFTGVISSECGITETVDVDMTFTNDDPPEFTSMDLLQSIDEVTWGPVTGDLATGFEMGLDPINPFYYLNVTNTATTYPLDADYFGFYLLTETVPADYYDYWTAKGVYSGTPDGPWQPQMWQIVSGQSPMFYLKAWDGGSGPEYQLVDGLQRDLGDPSDPFLRVSGDYPDGTYGFTGVISSECLVPNTVPVTITFANADLVITKTVELASAPALLGGPITYTVIVANIGGGDASNVTVTDVLPIEVDGVDLDWTGKITAGEQVELEIPAVITTNTSYYGATITNTAYYSHGTGTGSDDAALTIGTPPELAITKTVETVDNPAPLGSPVTYTIIVANSGDHDATGTVVTDVLPVGLAGGSIDWNGTVPGGSEVEFTLPALITDNWEYYEQTITNTAYYSHATGAGSDIAVFTIEDLPPLFFVEITKTVEPTTGVIMGGIVTYTIEVVNDTDNSYGGAILEDILPAGVTFQSWIVVQPHTTVFGNVIGWSGDIAPHETLLWVFTAQVIGEYGGQVTNEVSLGQNRYEKSDDATFTFELPPFVINEFMVRPDAVDAADGQWVEVYNGGIVAADLNGCVLLDDGTDWHQIDNGGPLMLVPNDMLVLGINGDMLTNGGVTVTYVYSDFQMDTGTDEIVLECFGEEVDRVDYNLGGTFPDPLGASLQLLTPAWDNNAGENWCVGHEAWAGSAGDYGTPDMANDCLYVDLSISKVVEMANDPAQLGDALTYTITVSNDGSEDAVGVVVTDVLPAGVVGADLDWTGTVSSAGEVELVIPATVADDAAYYGQTVTNDAYYEYQDDSGSAGAAFTIIGPPVLAITKTIEAPSPAHLGDPVVYTIVVANSGPADADDTNVTDMLPAGVSGDDLDWTGTITAGEEIEFTIEAMVDKDPTLHGQTITNTAYYSHAVGMGYDQAAFTVVDAPGLTIEKTVDLSRAPIHPGDAITYTVVVVNNNGTDAVGVVVTDTLPAGVTGTDLNWTGTITSGEGVEFVIPATLDAADDWWGETITNTAYYEYGADSDSADAAFTVRGRWYYFLPIILK